MSIARSLTVIAALLLPAPLLRAAPPEAYQKTWRDPAIQQRIARGIEQNRKGDLSLVVVDSAGKPIPGATIELQQQSHAFLFGCNAFVLGQLKTPEENQRYEEAFVRLFNFATVPFYWEGTEPARGELRYQEAGSRDIWRRPPPDRYLPWAAKNGVTLKGHPLLWHAYNPSWLPKDADELRELYRKRFREIATRYAGKIMLWDVVNESQVCPKTWPLFTPDRAYVGWAFAEAAPLFPDNTVLTINEVTGYNFRPADTNPYFAQVKAMLAAGSKIRGIGLQYHYFRREALDKHLVGAGANPAQMLDLYERFAEFKLPLYITEITIPSAGPDGEALQAEVVADHYRLWFSAPMMAGITWWNLGDGTAVKGENEAQGGLVDGQLKPKAAYIALEKLINTEWKTRANATTDTAGKATTRGFYGKYKMSVKIGETSRDFEIEHAAGSSNKQHELRM